MARKKKELPKHVLTLDEYDVLTMDMQCLGALTERNAIIQELQYKRVQLIGIADSAEKTQLAVECRDAAEGLFIAINFIEKMKHLEDRCGCRECGAI
jgi:hypothetical protein